MKKTQLIKLIRESIKKLREEKGPLNEAPGCSFDTKGNCGPGYCSEYQEDGGIKCGCNSFKPMSDDCDTTDTGGRSGDRVNKTPTKSLNEKEKGCWVMCDWAPSGGQQKEWCSNCNSENKKKKCCKKSIWQKGGKMGPSSDSKQLNETEKNYCVCKRFKCLRDPQSGGNSTISYGGCTGSGACSCINKGDASYGPTNISKKTMNENKKTRLTERFQQLAGIKPLYEQQDDLGDELGSAMAKGFDDDFGSFIDSDDRFPGEDKAGMAPRVEIMAAALLSTDDYKAVYFGDKEEFEEEGFEFIETFPITPYTLVMFSNEELSVYDYDSEEELIEEFGEMGFGGCDEEECGITEIIEVVNSLSADGSNPGLALLANGKEIANGGE